MKWYYSIRGDVTRHGVIDDTELPAMVQRGEIRATDLLWSDSTGNKWIPAASVDGLIAPPAPPALRLATPRKVAKSASPWNVRRAAFRVALVLFALAVTAAVVVLLRR